MEKIVHLCLACFYPDGYAYQENLLPKYHKKLGFDVEVIASQKTFNNEGKLCFMDYIGSYKNEYDISVHRLANKKPLPFYRKLNRYIGTYEALEEIKPDILFIHGLQFLDMDKVIRYLKKNKDTKVYVDNHADYINSARTFIAKNILHRILWRYTAHRILSYTTKFYGVLPLRVDFLQEMYGLPPEKIELLLMGADDEQLQKYSNDEETAKIRKELELSQEDFVVCSGGKFTESKREILNLMDAIIKMDGRAKLVIFGSVSHEINKEFKEKLKSNNIKYIGWINSFEVYKYFNISDLAVFPSTHSAMWEQGVGSGIACIFRKWKGIDHVDLGGNCIFVNNGSEDELYRSIYELTNNQNTFNTMKEVAKGKAKKVFSYTEIAKKSIDLK